MRKVKVTIELEIHVQDYIPDQHLAEPILYYNLAYRPGEPGVTEFRDANVGAIIWNQKITVEPAGK